jgi:signal transduction histidine kinase
VLGLLIAAVLVIVVQVVLATASSNAEKTVLEDRVDAVVSSVDNATTGSTLQVPDARLDPGVAVYDENGELVAGVVPPAQASAFADLSTATAVSHRRLGDSYELVGEPFMTQSGATGVVVVSEPLTAYQTNQHYALAVSIAAGVVIVLLAMGMAAWASRRALAPVAEMARTAEDWSEHDLDQRFALGAPTNEIRALGQTLDGLLEKVERAILAEQRLTSELAHELRSPLTAVQATAEVIAMRDDLDDELREDVAYIQDSCRAMAVTVTSLLELARAQSQRGERGTSDLIEVVDFALRGITARERVTVQVDPQLRVGVPVELAARAISPVLDNATRLGQHVEVSAVAQDSRVHVSVRDDGPGVPVHDAESVFAPGHTAGTGSGLGLALARRIARSTGGDVTLVEDDDHVSGATFVVSLPLG